MKKFVKCISIFVSATLITLLSSNSLFASDNLHVATYITGIGCPHCANVAPQLLEDRVNECDDMIIVEYEIYKQPENSAVIFEFNDSYNSGLGIPQIIFNKENILVGDSQINSNIDYRCEEAYRGTICLSNGECVAWEDLDLNDIILLPRIWSKDRIAIRTSENEISEDINILVKDFLTVENPGEYLGDQNLDSYISPIKVDISGGSIEFKNALEIDGWILQWNGEDETIINSNQNTNNANQNESETKVSFHVLLLF